MKVVPVPRVLHQPLATAELEIRIQPERGLPAGSPAAPAARAFSTEGGILTFGQGPQNLVVQEPGRDVLDARMAAVRWRGDAGFGLPDPMEGPQPSGERHSNGLQERADRERCLFAAGAALTACERRQWNPSGPARRPAAPTPSRSVTHPSGHSTSAYGGET